MLNVLSEFFWRQMTLPSTVNWCEEDYKHSSYIAEYWNTLSGLFLCFSSLYFYYINKDQRFYKLFYINKLLFFVGIGTMLFHGKLLYIFQLMDELPMVLIAIESTRLLQTLKMYNSKYGRSYSVYNSTKYILLLTIIFSYYISPTLEVIIFQGSLVYYVLLFCTTCKRLLSSDISNFKLKSNILFYIKISLTTSLLSITLWLIENNFCNNVNHLQLHAFWHLLTSISMYYLNNIIKTFILLNNEII